MEQLQNFRGGKKLIEIDEIKNDVLDAVTDERFDYAITILEKYLEQPSEYPQYKFRMSRMVTHCIHLIHAIRAKKHFPGRASLTRAKQQELNEKTKVHFYELEMTLTKMEGIMIQFMKEDLRSTLWVLRSFVYAAGIIVILAFLLDMTTGYWGVFEKVVENQVDKMANWIIPEE